MLVNLLESGSNDAKCRLGALHVLSKISANNSEIRKLLVDFDAIPLLVAILVEPILDLKRMAAGTNSVQIKFKLFQSFQLNFGYYIISFAETLSNVAKVRLAQKLVRKFGGIARLVDLLDIKLDILLTPRDQLTGDQIEQIDTACAGARALCSLSESRKNKEHMRKAGLVPLVSRLLKSVHIDLIIPIMGTCQQCASEVWVIRIRWGSLLIHLICLASCRQISNWQSSPRTWFPTSFIICIRKTWKLNCNAVRPYSNVPATNWPAIWCVNHMDSNNWSQLPKIKVFATIRHCWQRRQALYGCALPVPVRMWNNSTMYVRVERLVHTEQLNIKLK